MRSRALSAILLAACGEPAVVKVDSAVDRAADSAVDSAPTPTPTEPCIVWPGDWQAGTTRDDSAGVTITREGDVIVYGYELGQLGIENVEPAGEPRGFVARLPGHRWGWRWLLPAAYGGTVDAIDVRDDGLLQITGRVREPPPPESRAQYQLFVGQLDANGELVEYAELGDRPSEHPRQTASTNGWNAVAGYVDTYVPTNYLESVEDPFLVTWRDGGLESARLTRFETPWTDTVDGLAVAPDGRVSVAGSSRGGDTRGAFVRRFAADGAVIATEWISKGPLESLSAMRRLPDGDVIVAGSTWLPLDGRPSAGGEDVFVARFDQSFTTRRWLRKLGTASSEIVVDMHVDTDGRSWILGETLGSFDDLPNRGDTDLFVAALSSDGEVRWVEQRGSVGDERPTRVAVDACENVLVAGATNGSLVDGFGPSGYDAFVVRVR